MVVLEIEMNQANQRLDKFLGKVLPGAPSGFFYKMLRKKNITLNGKKAEGKAILRQGDRVTLWLADETILTFGGYLPRQEEGGGSVGDIGNPAAARPMDGEHFSAAADTGKGERLYRQAYRQLQGVKILYEDAHVLILDKPAGVLTQQAREEDLSLNEWMIGYLLKTGGMDSRELRLFRPSVCNRLDRNTSGLVLCGKSLPGSQALSELIRSHKVRKFYRALCVGEMAKTDWGNGKEIQGYLQKDSRSNKVTVILREPCPEEAPEGKKQGEYIRTVYFPRERFSFPPPAEERQKPAVSSKHQTGVFTELEIELITGKSHQIRAHLASIGHPLVGDGKYGDAFVNRLFRQRFGLRWQLLHACRLQFPVLDGVLAPLSGKSIRSPLPSDFTGILRELKKLDKSV